MKENLDNNKLLLIKAVLKITLAYLIVGVLWILFSDRLSFYIVQGNIELLNSWQNFKGLFYILATSIFLFFFTKKYLNDIYEKTQKLTEASERYSTLIKQSSEGVFRFEIHKPIPVSLPIEKQIKLFYELSYLAECNEAMAKMYGFSNPSQLIGAKLDDFLIPSIPENTKYLKNFALNNYRIVDWESHEVDKDGNKKYFLNNLLGIVEYGNLVRAWGAQRDITKLKEAEEALKASEDLYRTVVKSLDEGLVITDIEDHILFANQRMSEMTGYAIVEMVGQLSYEILCEPADRDKILAKNKLRLTDKSDTYEIMMHRKDGSKFWVSINGTPYKNSKGEIIGTVGAINNITSAKLTQRMLKESEEKYRLVVEQVREVIFQTDDEGKIIFLNPYWSEMTGYDLNASIGKNFTEFIFPDDRRRVMNEFISVIYKKIEFSRHLVRCVTSDGGIRWIEINARLMFNRDNVIIGTSGTISDINERKLAEEELIKAKEKAEESDRLKSIFLAQVSHEIRTPLNIILSYNSLIQDEVKKKSGNILTSEFQTIENGGKRLLRTMDLILNMSMIQSGNYEVKFEKVDLSLLLQKLIRESNSLAQEKKLKLCFYNNSANSKIFADEYTITQAFQNIIDNAIKYTNSGKVEITIYENGGESLLVDITDTGIGISNEYMPKLYTPFSQEEIGYSRKFEGNGLGLALTRKYFELNKADINVKSKKGEGTTFTILLKLFK
jgi:PAS domain S-box-containing protein